MLSTVHAYLNLKKNELGVTLGKLESSISIKYPSLSMSDTKLSKIFRDPTAKISIEELLAIVDCMGLDKRELLSIIGEQEYRASATVGYMGAAELIADFERREAAIRQDYEQQLIKAKEIREGLQHAFEEAKEGFVLAVNAISNHRDQELAKRDEIQHQVVDHLRRQLVEKDDALITEKKSAASDRKSLKWWRAAAIILCCILVFTFVYIVWEIMNLDKGATAFLIEMVKLGLL